MADPSTSSDGRQAEALFLEAVQVARGQGSLDPSSARWPEELLHAEVKALEKSRVQQLLEQVLMEPHVEQALQWLHDVGLLKTILPELDATVDFTQEMDRRHKDVWKHTKQVVAQSTRQREVRWAALLHDIGKVITRALTPEGKVTFYGHAEVGARMFDRVAVRLSFEEPLRGQIRFLILHHLRANQYDGTWTDSAVRRFARDMGPQLDSLLALSQADITSARPGKRQRALAQIDELSGRIAALQEIDSRVPPLPSGLGNQIMERFQLRPSRLIGDLRRHLEQAIEEGKLEPHLDSDYYLDFLKQHPQLIGKP